MVPARLDVSNALDDTVRCLCAGYVAFMLGVNSEHELTYSKALGSLRESLDNDEEAFSAEVLCATICLSWYEV